MDSNEGYLLISITTIVLLAFVISFLIIMMVYRKRKLEHAKEVETMNEKFTKELLNTQLEIQQQTMQHIGREIHDNVGQKLTLAALYMQQLDAENKSELNQKKITAVNSIINESLHDLRSLSKNLTDTSSLQNDLYELIGNECASINAVGSCIVELESNTKQLQASYAVKNFVLRILQEFLQNSLKHSGCTEIKVKLQKEEQGLMIKVFDNGKGFSSTGSSSGIGLQNMKKRAAMIGADLLIQSSPNEGTSMNLFIPTSKLDI